MEDPMAALVKLPISNVPTGGGYTGVIAVGSQPVELTVILDTGSSTLAVDGHAFDPLACPATRTTNLAQQVQYGAGRWLCAVVQAPVGLAPGVGLEQAQLAVTYEESPGMFGGAQGILGLAYARLDSAYVMPADSWTSRYSVDQLATATVADLAPYFTALERAGVVSNKFAFYARRSAVSLATDDPATDPANHGVLVLGGGEEATELYTGPFTTVELVHDVWYNTCLVAVQVGARPRIPVAPLPAGSALASNSIVDSGTNCLLFAQPVYDAIIAAFGALEPAFAAQLRAHAVGAAVGLDHAQLDLARWPDLRLVFRGCGGAEVTLAIAPAHYWQLDAAARGQALAYLCGDGGARGGQSILGLPLLSAYYAVFDRSQDDGRGVIKFATRA
ncbi:MAG: pepsin-like aspartic protease [Kofleriaceae bacterium]